MPTCSMAHVKFLPLAFLPILLIQGYGQLSTLEHIHQTLEGGSIDMQGFDWAEEHINTGDLESFPCF
jgi:hypothetical protein